MHRRPRTCCRDPSRPEGGKNMRFRELARVVVVLLAAAVSASAFAEPVKVATEASFPPFSSRNARRSRIFRSPTTPTSSSSMLERARSRISTPTSRASASAFMPVPPRTSMSANIMPASSSRSAMRMPTRSMPTWSMAASILPSPSSSRPRISWPSPRARPSRWSA
jgi:hypothetical protein